MRSEGIIQFCFISEITLQVLPNACLPNARYTSNRPQLTSSVGVLGDAAALQWEFGGNSPRLGFPKLKVKQKNFNKASI
ncbi:hypothetical protein C7B61_18000 [filamentous cyanobacterium CCP1]|nr:hypothetical protein C7B76_27095 [filamentous cyanobacterium CCP2]PSB60135.1 hypothetical protein C7B61_18000 [filamentous cyanobacterium CCP1]